MQKCKCLGTSGQYCGFCISLHIADGCCTDFANKPLTQPVAQVNDARISELEEENQRLRDGVEWLAVRLKEDGYYEEFGGVRQKLAALGSNA